MTSRQYARTELVLLLIAFPLVSGCAYDGVIYSSYQEGGLGIRTTADSTAPIKVHFGYDHAVAAFVPRRGGDSASEEATSIISKDEVTATFALPVTIDPNVATTAAAKEEAEGPKTMIAVDSAFITGTAAIVASAPAGAEVKILPAAAPRGEAGKGAAPTLTVVTDGTAGDRIGMALTLQGQLSTVQVALANVSAEIRAKAPAVQDKIYDRAAGHLPQEFQQSYQGLVSGHAPKQAAFTNASRKFLKGQPSDSDRHKQLLRALTQALKEN